MKGRDITVRPRPHHGPGAAPAILAFASIVAIVAGCTSTPAASTPPTATPTATPAVGSPSPAAPASSQPSPSAANPSTAPVSDADIAKAVQFRTRFGLRADE